MATLTIDCPKTGLPLRTAIGFTALAGEPGTVVSLHCPHCSEMHCFSYADATIEITPDPRRTPAGV
jgi:hypothetical protein